jgi:hypothetical protein
MTAPGVRPTPEQVRSWRYTGHPYKLIAAEIAEWAAGKERGTALPDDETFGRNLDVTVSRDTYRRARRFLVAQGVLDAGDGPCQVA